MPSQNDDRSNNLESYLLGNFGKIESKPVPYSREIWQKYFLHFFWSKFILLKKNWDGSTAFLFL
jgi:hypothetical protein